MTLVDRRTLTRARRHPQAQARQATRGEPKPEPTGDSGVPPSGPQHPAPPITKQAPISPPEVAGKMDQPAPEREAPAFGLLVLVGAIFGLAVLKEFARIGGPVVVKVKSVPRPPAFFWIVGGVGTLGRIGARVLSR